MHEQHLVTVTNIKVARIDVGLNCHTVGVYTIFLVVQMATTCCEAVECGDGGLGIKDKYFAVDEDEEGPPIKESIIRRCLRANYENFLKLGYTPDFHTLQGMKTGELPPVRTGPSVGSRAEIGTISDAALSPGLDRVVANLEIRPPRKSGSAMNDVEIAAAKQLAKDLSDAGVIETAAADRIIESLTPKPFLPHPPEE